MEHRDFHCIRFYNHILLVPRDPAYPADSSHIQFFFGNYLYTKVSPLEEKHSINRRTGSTPNVMKLFCRHGEHCVRGM